jgi:hypothetical protein
MRDSILLDSAALRAYCAHMKTAVVIATLALTALAASPARSADSQEFSEFNSHGVPRSQGVVVRVRHPAQWKQVVVDDEMALAELRGPQGRLTGTLQIGRGARRQDMDSLCQPGRARTMLQSLAAEEQDARVTDVFARKHEGRPAYEIRYERHIAPAFVRVRSLVVCLKDSQLVVSCAGAGEARNALAEIEPVCGQVLESLTISEE